MISHLVTTRVRPTMARARRSATNTALPHAPGTPKYPLVLCHGYLGFVDALSPINRISSAIPSLHYFRGVVAHLRSLGAIVFTPTVPPFGSIRDRSEALRTQLLEWRAQGLWRGAARVHLIGHSYALCAISKKRIISITSFERVSFHHWRGSSLSCVCFFL